MKIGIAIDDWRLGIFERRLRAAGYAFEKSPGVTDDTLLLTVNTTNVQALQVVIRAAQAEAVRTGKPA